MRPGKWAHLAEHVIGRAATQPEALTVLFINEDGQETRVTALDFHRQAMAFAHSLSAIGIRCGDLVVLVLKHQLELLYGFWGALYMGAIPSIFPYLTEKLDAEVYKQRVKVLVAQSDARALITFPEFRDELLALLADQDCRVVSVADVVSAESGNSDGNLLAHIDPEQIAFLQHSSGTTGLQKGVALSHGAVLEQIETYGEAIRLNGGDVVVSWLPLYHDMGLIAGFVMPIVAGIPLVLMSPFHWVRSPATLLRAMERHKGTLCWLPNFAYNHSARGIRQRDLDGVALDHVRAFINCSEPVRHDSHQLFLERFGGLGINESQLATCYAMAENTFAVTQSPVGWPANVDWVDLRTLQQERRAVRRKEGENGASPMVSCGPAIPGVDIGVVDDEGKELPERNVGEVIIRSGSMLTEYYRRPELTSEAIRGGYYYTGDMGYLAGGELYISGRKKDLIIVGGKNIYPQDLEAIANKVPGIYPGRAVAFGVFDERLGSESVVMVCELVDQSSTLEKRRIEQALRRMVVQQTEVTLTDVRLVDERWLLKTSSGKIARGANRDKYLQLFRDETY